MLPRPRMRTLHPHRCQTTRCRPKDIVDWMIANEPCVLCLRPDFSQGMSKYGRIGLFDVDSF